MHISVQGLSYVRLRDALLLYSVSFRMRERHALYGGTHMVAPAVNCSDHSVQRRCSRAHLDSRTAAAQQSLNSQLIIVAQPVVTTVETISFNSSVDETNNAGINHHQ
jgi:hypothetical protein